MSLNSPGVADLIIDYCISPERFKQILKIKKLKYEIFSTMSQGLRLCGNNIKNNPVKFWGLCKMSENSFQVCMSLFHLF